MATRLTTRLSAGAALVTGLGMIGIASATPAQAEITGSLEYTCEETGQNPQLNDPWTVAFALDIEERVEQGAAIPAAPLSATVTPGDDAAELLRGLNVETLEGTGTTSYTFGEDGEQRDLDLEVPQTQVPAEGPIEVTATGESVEETAPAEDTVVPIIAGDFTAQLENQDGFVFQIECTAPQDATAGNVAVGDVELPEEDEDAGDGTEDGGTEDGDDTGGDTGGGDDTGGDTGGGDDTGGDTGTGDDAETGDEADEGAGDSGDDGAGAGDDAGAGDAGGTDGGPEIPDVVQTDGVSAAGTVGDSPVALGMGGLLLAGAGAGAVVVARRRAAQH